MRTLIASLAFVLFAGQAFADAVLVQYKPTAPGNSSIPLPPNANSFSASTLTSTCCLGFNPSAVWPVLVPSTSPTVDLTKYMEFSLSGPAVITKVVYFAFQPSLAAGSASSTMQIRSSNDGFAAPLATIAVTSDGAKTLNLGNLPITTAPTTFRIYIYNAVNVLETSINGNGGNTGLQVFGDVPALTKGFAPSPIPVSGTSILTFTLGNPTTTTVTNAAFTDTLPGPLLIAAAPAPSNGCGGVLTATPGTNAISYTGGTMSSNSICQITVPVTSATAGSFTNTTGALTSTQSNTGSTGSAVLQVATALTTLKSFSPAVVAVGSASTMQIVVANPNAFALTGVSISDTYPAGLLSVATGTASACGGTQTITANSVSLTGATLGAGASCTMLISVTSAAAGTFVNTTSQATANAGVTGAPATGAVTFVTAPTVTKVITAPSLALGQSTTMTLTLTNPNTVGITGVALADVFPAGLQPSNPGGTCTPTATVAGQTLSISGVSLGVSPNNQCTITATVTATQAGNWTNTTNAPTTTGPVAVTGVFSNSDSVLVVGPPTLTKTFTPSTILFNSTSTLTVVVNNPNSVGLINIAFSDTMPAGVIVEPAVTNGCGATFVVSATGFSLSGAALLANTSCTITALVRGVTPGNKVNTTSAVTANYDTQLLLTGAAATDTLIVAAPVGPNTTKGFAPSSIAMSGTSVMSFNIANPNSVAMTGVAFTDSLPAGMIVSQTVNLNNTCGGTVTAVSNATSVSLTGGTIPANGTCLIQITVQGTAPGALVNTTSSVTGVVSTVAVTGTPATATLNVAVSQVSFLMRYASNLSIGESVVNFTNSGESSTFSFGGNLAQNGEICANVFAYSPDEQLVSCCSCNVTPNALNSLSVKADLGTNTLTPIIPSSLVIKVVATQGGTACTASSAATVNTAVLQPGLAAWGTTLHALPATGGTTAGTYGVIETPFSLGTITQPELQRMAQLCSFIRANGSGFGICKSCKVGGLGASSK